MRRIVGRLGVVWSGVVLAVAMVLSVMTPASLAADAGSASITLDWNTQSVSKKDFMDSDKPSSISGSLNADGVWTPPRIVSGDDPITEMESRSFPGGSASGDTAVYYMLDGWNTKADGTGDWYDFSGYNAYPEDGADCGKDATYCYIPDVVRNGLHDVASGGVKYPSGGVLYAQWHVGERWPEALPDRVPEQKVTRSQLNTFVANTVWSGSYFVDDLHLYACSTKNDFQVVWSGSCMPWKQDNSYISFGAMRVGKSGKATVSFADRIPLADKSGADFDAWADRAFKDRTYRYVFIAYFSRSVGPGVSSGTDRVIATIDMDRSDSSVSFKDVTDKTPHADDIRWLASTGISTGWKESDGSSTFRGMSSVKRQDMAAFLYRLAGSPKFDESKVRNPFRDVTSKTPHYKEIMWLYSTGISTGWKLSDGSFEFRGMNSVVRQDMAAFLHRLADYEKAKPTLGKDVPFKDVNSATPHSADITWLAKTGVTTGWAEKDGSTTFRGMSTVKRQDMAAFLHRMKLNVLK